MRVNLPAGNNYGKLKKLAIALAGLWMPLGMYIGYCFGAGNYKAGTIALAIYIILCYIDTLVGWRMWEILTGNKNSSENSHNETNETDKTE